MNLQGWRKRRGRAAGGQGAHFGRSETGIGSVDLPHYYLAPQIFRPTAIPGLYSLNNEVKQNHLISLKIT